MQLFKLLQKIVLAVLLMTMITSCKEDVYVTVTGAVSVSKSAVSNGDEIVLRINDFDLFVVSQRTGLFGGNNNSEDPITAISYYIDDNKIASSDDEKSGYSATYTIQDLSPGMHTVSARCDYRSDDYETKEIIHDNYIMVNQ